MADWAVQTYHHENGRKCIMGPDGIWRHWDADHKHVGPRDEVDWQCRLDHYFRDTVTTKVEVKDDPAPIGYDEDGHPIRAQIGDRGDFGMPILGKTFGEGLGKVLRLEQQGLRCTIDRDTLSIDNGDVGVDFDAATPEAHRVLEKIPYILLHFLEKNAGYARAQSGHDLGIKGIIPDINRKTAALITQVWDGGHAPGDSTEELVGDLIGHLLLLLAKIE